MLLLLRSVRCLAWLKADGSAPVMGEVLVTEIADTKQVLLDPSLQFRYLDEFIRYLEALEIADDPRGLNVLVEVDDIHRTVLGTKTTSVLVTVINEGKIGKIHSNERKARRNVVLESSAKSGVVP